MPPDIDIIEIDDSPQKSGHRPTVSHRDSIDDSIADVSTDSNDTIQSLEQSRIYRLTGQNLPSIPFTTSAPPFEPARKLGTRAWSAGVISIDDSSDDESVSRPASVPISAPALVVPSLSREKPESMRPSNVFRSLPELPSTKSWQKLVSLPDPLLIAKALPLPREAPVSARTEATVRPRPMTETSSNLLSDLDKLLNKQMPAAKKRKRAAPTDSQRSARSDTEQDSDHLELEPPQRPDSSVAVRRAEEKKRLAEDKAAAKEAEKLRKATEKEEKAKAKLLTQSIAAVNTLKKSKKDTSPEMIVDVCTSIESSALQTHLNAFMDSLGCTWNVVPMPVLGLVKFRRKVVANFNPELGYWLPLQRPEVRQEKQLVVILKGHQYVNLARSKDDLAQHVASVRRVGPDHKILYLIEGLAAIMRKAKTAENRAFQAAVRANGLAPGESASRPRRGRRAAVDDEMDEETIEDSLLDLQVYHRCLITHTKSPQDTAEQLSVLTSDLSVMPYKQERTGRSAQFCTDVGQIKTGTDERDTYEKMLQQIQRVTPQVASAIAQEFSGLRQLARKLETGGPAVLEGIRKNFNVDGRATGQCIGAATASRVHHALTATDPNLEA